MRSTTCWAHANPRLIAFGCSSAAPCPPVVLTLQSPDSSPGFGETITSRNTRLAASWIFRSIATAAARGYRQPHMKTPIAITLIIVGAVLILAPIVADQLHQARVAELLLRPEIRSVNLGGETSELYRFGCWLVGTSIIILAVRCSIGQRTLTASGGLDAAAASVSAKA